MKNLKKYIGLAVIGIALCLGIFVTNSNAQRRGFSFNISIGRPSYYRVYRPRYYRRPVVTYYDPYYEPRSVYYPSYNYYDPYTYNNGYVVTRRYYRRY